MLFRHCLLFIATALFTFSVAIPVRPHHEPATATASSLAPPIFFIISHGLPQVVIQTRSLRSSLLRSRLRIGKGIRKNGLGKKQKERLIRGRFLTPFRPPKKLSISCWQLKSFPGSKINSVWVTVSVVFWFCVVITHSFRHVFWSGG